MLEPQQFSRLGALKVAISCTDITELRVDAVVNAANNALQGGGGVDGAIHRAAGPQLLEACGLLGGCPTGEAVITPGFRMHAQHIIHTVGPVWQGGEHGEPELLASCYAACLALADAEGIESLAFPAISTGVYGFPKSPAARIALETTAAFVPRGSKLTRVVFALFDEPAAATYHKLLQELA